MALCLKCETLRLVSRIAHILDPWRFGSAPTSEGGAKTMHNVRECKEARSCSTSKISTTCLVRCRKERTVPCREVYREWKHVAHRYPRTGSPDQLPKEKRPVARKKRRELGEEAFHGSASCLLNPTASGHRRSTARAFSRCSSMGVKVAPLPRFIVLWQGGPQSPPPR